VYHGGGYRGGYVGGYRGGYYGGYRGYYPGGYGYWGNGYPYSGFWLGYGLGLGSRLGYGLGYGYGYPYSGGYSYPYTDSSYYPTVPSVPLDNTLVPSTPSATPAPATVTFMVPNGAEVWFDGKETPTTGTTRVFTSPILQPDQSEVLSVRAVWDGSARTMQVPLHAGDNMTIDLR
jgi:uncharacterized protein (TIGR03000 family)